MNKVVLMGRLTRDPELRVTSGENPLSVCHYNLAINRSFKKDSEADFLNVTAFGKRGEFAEKYFKKGMMVAVIGELRSGNYIDKNGVKKYTTDVIALEQHFTGGKGGTENKEVAIENL